MGLLVKVIEGDLVRARFGAELRDEGLFTAEGCCTPAKLPRGEDKAMELVVLTEVSFIVEVRLLDRGLVLPPLLLRSELVSLVLSGCSFRPPCTFFVSLLNLLDVRELCEVRGVD